MERIEKTVFLSYRRTNISWALAIFKDLTQHGYDVFFDFNGIASGDFESIILQNIPARAHFLVLLTPSALERCDDPADWLRREIETALDNQRNIVPLMLEGFDFETPKIAKQLTGGLAALKHYNAVRIPPDYFDHAMERLRNSYLNIPLSAVLHPASLAAQRAATQQKAAADAAPAVQEKDLTLSQLLERGLAAVNEEVRLYDEAIRLKPDDANAFTGRGYARYITGDGAGAIKDFNEAIRLKPDDPDAFTKRAIARSEQGDDAGAIKDFNKAKRLKAAAAEAAPSVQEQELTAQQWFERAFAAVDPDEQLRFYNEAIRLKPDDADAFNNRGNARSDQGDLAGAIKDYNKAIRLKPDYADAFTNRGVARNVQGDLAGAIKDYNKAIRLKPDDATAFNNRGNARNAQGDLAGAIKDYNEAIRLKPDYADAFTNRGNARNVQGDLAGAIKDYNEAIRLKPDDAVAFNNRSNARNAQGDLAGADEDFKQAERLKAAAGLKLSTKRLIL
jgi:tetratricopeptide (TPR) repeat protein